QRPASGDITIVAIDSESLTQIGRWPWPRGVYAQMIDRLTEAGARGVLLDLVLDEENVEDPAGDEELAVAIARNGRVVLPVLVEAARHGGPIEEILPIPPISAAAAALGHVDVALDGDGIAREVYLYAGDRKSTRLNSSHVKISYAVFCLKKKKTK